MHQYTVEPLYNGHIETDYFVCCPLSELPLYRLVHWKVCFIQRCPLFRVSFIRGSTVYIAMVNFTSERGQPLYVKNDRLLLLRGSTVVVLISGSP